MHSPFGILGTQGSEVGIRRSKDTLDDHTEGVVLVGVNGH